ncbi:MAG: ImmA/IrrE family metallo-endopeptidase [Gammaproteobacteria bacterium]|nr:ImmA/IrrE family metallo-endopeptidase [Gammaproteobacteria bacterium]
MAAVYAKINPSILTWARERAQVGLDVLAKKFNISIEKLEGWESGEIPLTFKQAQKYANKLHIPFGYLFLPTAPEEHLPLPDLRTINGEHPHQPSSELLDIVQLVFQRMDWYREYLIDQNHEPNPHVGKFDLKAPVTAIVNDMRKTLGVAPHPQRGTWEEYFRNLIERIENNRILVMRQGFLGHYTRPLNVSEFRGFAIADPVSPIIFINQADAPSARLFTLIHELTHIWIGQSGISDAAPQTQNKSEVLCNAVAAEFLVPEGEFLRLWDDNSEKSWQENIAPLKSHFHISSWVLARRALTLNKISEVQYKRFIANLQLQHKNKDLDSTNKCITWIGRGSGQSPVG